VLTLIGKARTIVPLLVANKLGSLLGAGDGMADRVAEPPPASIDGDGEAASSLGDASASVVFVLPLPVQAQTVALIRIAHASANQWRISPAS
jgi:hypothetical protein